MTTKPSFPAKILNRNERVSEEMINRLADLLDCASAAELRENLLELYHYYIIHQHESLPSDFKTRAENLQLLFDFLKFAAQERVES